MTRHILAATIGVGLWLALTTVPASAQTHGWPLDPMGAEHPMGNSMGEYQDFGGVYQHTGIDIRGNPMLVSGVEDPSAPWVRVTVGGTPTQLSNVPGTNTNGTTIDGTDLTTYRYWHLQHNSYDPGYVVNFNNGTAVAAGDRIAKLVFWVYCSPGYHHLHYDLENGGNYVNPLAAIVPNPDPDRPSSPPAIAFARDDGATARWSTFTPVTQPPCTVVSGATDVIVQMRDRDDAGLPSTGTSTLWIYNARWRACPDSMPSCAWLNTWQYDNMPTTWGINGNAGSIALFSSQSPFASDSWYCNDAWLYGIVTNIVGGTPNMAGRWNTSAISDGSYSVSVEGRDFAGNVQTFNTRACVQNTVPCVTELTVRDAAGDVGAIPYLGATWTDSPDVTVNPGTPNQDLKITIGVANSIDVQAWNYGSCTLPAGATYQVCLGWAPASPAVPHPLPAGQNIGCQNVTVPAAGWAPGTSRVTTVAWTPAVGSVPAGASAIVAWVDLAADPVLVSPSVNQDDNRAQQNVTLEIPPVAAPTGLTCASKELKTGWQDNLTWTDNSGDESEFHIERMVAGGMWGEIAPVGANVTAFTDFPAPPDTYVSYRVRAHRHGDGEFSAYSNVATCSTKYCTPKVCPKITGKVPPAAIADAVANPEAVAGYCKLQNPNIAWDPFFNSRRMSLTLHNMGLAYDARYNGLTYKSGCY